MDANKVAPALHGFLSACGLRASRGEGDMLNVGSDDAADDVGAFLSAPLMDHLKTHKSAILNRVDAQKLPVAQAEDEEAPDADTLEEDDSLVKLAARLNDPTWRAAVANTLGRVAELRWTKRAGLSVHTGRPIPDRSKFISDEVIRLRAVCNITPENTR